jgi:MFS family permease
MILVQSTVVVVIVLIPTGMMWVAMLATVNTMLQLFLPRWVRARGLSVYQMVLFGAQGLGAVAWGLVADSFGLTLTFLVAAALMAVGTAFDPHLAFRRHLPDGPQHGGSARPAGRARASGGRRTGRGAHDLFDPDRARG